MLPERLTTRHIPPTSEMPNNNQGPLPGPRYYFYLGAQPPQSWGEFFSSNMQAGLAASVQGATQAIIQALAQLAVTSLISRLQEPPQDPNTSMIEDQEIRIEILRGNCSAVAKEGGIYPNVIRMLAEAQHQKDPLYPTLLTRVVKCIEQKNNKKTQTPDEQPVSETVSTTQIPTEHPSEG